MLLCCFINYKNSLLILLVGMFRFLAFMFEIIFCNDLGDKFPNRICYSSWIYWVDNNLQGALLRLESKIYCPIQSFYECAFSLTYSSHHLNILVSVFCWDTSEPHTHTAVCSSPRASRTLFLLLAAEAMLTVSLLRGFFKLDLKGLFMLAENNMKV